MSDPHRRNRLLQIADCEQLEQLRSIRIAEQIKLEAEFHSFEADDFVHRLNELQDAIIAATVNIAENDLARKGLGAPPVPYAYLLFGSGGRSEQTMHSDQDSGLVYADSDDEASAEGCRSYFGKLTQKIVGSLVFVGYPPCEGRVLASNTDWCKPLSGWLKTMEDRFAEPNWENVRYLLITADSRAVKGDTELAEKLKDHFFKQLENHRAIAGRMLENTLHHKVLVGFFGQLLPERYGMDAGNVDIKYGAYIPMVNAFRLLAVRARIRDTNTLERIEQLKQAAALTASEAEEARQAFLFILQLRMIEKVTPAQLTGDRMASLKSALRTGRKLQSKLQREMKDRSGGR